MTTPSPEALAAWEAHTECPADSKHDWCAGYDAMRAAAKQAEGQAKGEPDGYALVQSGGYFIGIWRTREIAQQYKNRLPFGGPAEEICPMVFLKENGA